MAINKPNVYSERESHVKNEKYLFVSYSHRDVDFVYEKLNKLYDMGLNFWYDREIGAGKSWSKVAEAAMLNENCIGIIYFLSCNSVLSEAISKEIEFAGKKQEMMGDGFLVIPIVIKGGSYYQLVQQAFISLKDETAANLELQLPFERVKAFLDYFPNEDLFRSSSPENFEEDIIHDAEKHNRELLSTSNNVLIVMQNEGLIMQKGIGYVFKFAKYPLDRDNDVTFLGDGLFEKTYTSEWFYKRDGVCYDVDYIIWSIIFINNSIIKSLSSIYLNCCYYREIESSLAFIKTIISHFSNDVEFTLRLPTIAELKKYPHTIPEITASDFTRDNVDNYAYNNLGFWAMNDDGKIVVIDNNCNIIDNNQTTLAGLRLMLEINKDNLKTYVDKER